MPADGGSAPDVRRVGVRASMHDVAARAGVSHMTVSRVLNGHPRIRDETRARVLKAVEETGYIRSSIARAMRTNRSMRLGVLIDGPWQHGPNNTLRAFERVAQTRGYSVNALSLEPGKDIHADVLELVLQGVDGLCVIAPRPSLLERIRKFAVGLPVLVIKDETDEGMVIVSFDQSAGATSAVEHLIGLGHRTILHLSGAPDSYDSLIRSLAWRAALERAGLSVREPLAGDWSPDSGYTSARDYDLGDATAIFVSNDHMAMGAIHALHERGIRVPQDMSIVGFDDIPESRHYLPALTTVRQDFQLLGAAAADDLLLAVEGRYESERPRLKTELIVRDSTAPPPGR
ncbi:LacI family DNA-binding transcriptional regulator [Agromyces aerolatus]|uniref:LacI family DNA-binding transcriptional regulator n=1 Tax=Agromyces sp. LY-1074 TaxID=3074080 RepID=UPI0028558B37|nr:MULTISPECIES: LacI family DNA-binding transcriptional regulator [unclassified Agromyces]MDR5700894.1 LacI family DNA-binding transcriptional regulator [Agromyces sp. LY-1074]MDR5707445.1 LacI family DNA-binding transcriptional regulator [Agromyces sp. LY-1358]